MADPFLGEIRIFPFNFAPKGWAMCNGQLMPVSENNALHSVLGYTYGDEGKPKFALPNMQGSAPMHPGQGPGLSLHDLGETGGSRTVKLLESEMPAHSHGWMASNKPGTNQSPVNEMFAAGVGGITMYAEAVVQIYINVDVGFQGSISRVDPTTKQESPARILLGVTIHFAEPGTEWRFFSGLTYQTYITTGDPVQNVQIAPSPMGGFQVIVHEPSETGNPVVTQLASNALTTAGGNQPHNNMMPYLTLNFCIAVEGLFPSRT